MRIYVAGPYSAPTLHEIVINVEIARLTAAELWTRGHEAFCPHVASHDVHIEAQDVFRYEIAYERWIAHSLGIIEAWAEALFVIAGSPGTFREMQAARRKGIPIYRNMADVPKVWGAA